MSSVASLSTVSLLVAMDKFLPFPASGEDLPSLHFNSHDSSLHCTIQMSGGGDSTEFSSIHYICIQGTSNKGL